MPQADEFQGEYISENNMRLRWMTGFTGSAGTAVLFEDHIHLFVDGRSSKWLPDGMKTRVDGSQMIEFFPAVAGG